MIHISPGPGSAVGSLATNDHHLKYSQDLCTFGGLGLLLYFFLNQKYLLNLFPHVMFMFVSLNILLSKGTNNNN